MLIQIKIKNTKSANSNNNINHDHNLVKNNYKQKFVTIQFYLLCKTQNFKIPSISKT